MRLPVAVRTVIILGAAFAATGCSRSTERTANTTGGALVATIRSSPATFNRLVGQERALDLLGRLTYGQLIRINRSTWEVEPWLAESWSSSPDHLRYTIKLRPNVTFSDGHPFTSDDVVFSFAAVYDEKTASPLADAMMVRGRRLAVEAPDPQTVVITFPSPFGPGLRILNDLWIVPRHKLGAAVASGTFAKAWGLGTPLSDIVGLGPFTLTGFEPGQRLVFSRNPRYWRKDAAGHPLPYLDRITMDVVTEQDAETLRLQSGQSDLIATEIRTSDYTPLKRLADAGRINLLDLGDGYDADWLWINLKPGAFPKDDSRAAWIQRDELRHAISMAVDRQTIVNTVYLGAAAPVFGPIAPANVKWYAADVPHPAHDPARARQLLASIGLTDRNGGGLLEDARSQPAHITLITQKGRSDRERAVAVIRNELRKVGIQVDVATLDFLEVVKRIYSGNYEAIYLGAPATDVDPASNMDFWISSGAQHFWNPSQKKPATEWEARIDELMARQVASADEGERKRIFADVQRIFAEHEPALYFAAPHVFVATSSRVRNLTPSRIAPQVLWAADTIQVR
jgi:peptide/nickel transport system substrate-binding protein